MAMSDVLLVVVWQSSLALARGWRALSSEFQIATTTGCCCCCFLWRRAVGCAAGGSARRASERGGPARAAGFVLGVPGVLAATAVVGFHRGGGTDAFLY